MVKSVSTENYSLFLKLLVMARKQSLLTQKDVASKLGKNQSYISKYENGERRLDLIEFIELSKVIDFDPSRLLKDLVEGWR